MGMSQLEQSYYPALVRNVVELLALKPWLTLEPTDIFAVQAPGSDELLFVQASGGGDEPFELMAYRGARGLELLWELNNCENPAFVADMSVDVPALFFTVVGESDLDNLDKEILADVESEFSVSGYPVFRCCQPGFQPGHLRDGDVHLLMHIVRQVCEVVQQVNDGSLSLEVEDGQEDTYLLRKPEESDDGLIVWHNEHIDMNLDDKLPKKYPKLKRAELALLKDLPQNERELRLELQVSPYVSGDESEETPSTFLFTVSDQLTGELLCARIEEPGAKLAKFRDSLLQTFQELLQRLGERPKAVHVEALSLCDMLGDVIGKLGIELKHHALDVVRPAEAEAVLRHFATRYVRTAGKLMFV